MSVELRRCAEIAPLLVFYACDEVEPQEREQIDAHLVKCESCSAQLREEQEIQNALVSAFQPADELDPSGVLLAQCRSELSEMLDDLEAPQGKERWSPFEWIRRWMTLRPGWSAAGLAFAGLLVGTQVALWIPGRDGGSVLPIGQAVNVKAAAPLTNEELAKMAVAGINVAPGTDSTMATVQLQVRTEQPMVVSGSVDDTDVRRVLTYVVANGERFDPGVRLDCLDVLKVRAGNEEVRHALLAAARRDHNAAVRMKALEALRDAAKDDGVRETLLDTLQHDVNPGVRVEAVNLLVRSLENESMPESAVTGIPAGMEVSPVPVDPSVGRVIRALEGLQRTDPSRYVRLRSAAALRQISTREPQ